MTHPEQTTLLAEFYAEKKNVLKLKGEDYANEDVLSNFKTAGANCGISAELQCLSLIATKVARLGNLLTGKTPNNESISDSILDLSNYTDLLYCLVNEDITNKVESEKPKGIVQGIKDEQKCLLKEIMQDDEKDGLYEIGTNRWENIAPHPMLDAIANMNKTIKAGAEWHKKRREEAEAISEPYVPKVGDRFRSLFGEYLNVIYVGGTHCILSRHIGSLTREFKIFHDKMHEYIKSGILEKY